MNHIPNQIFSIIKTESETIQTKAVARFEIIGRKCACVYVRSRGIHHGSAVQRRKSCRIEPRASVNVHANHQNGDQM